jgi:hypothetical protein
VPLCFGSVLSRQRGKVNAEAGIVGRLSAGNELSHLEGVQKTRGPFLGCHGSSRGGEGSDCESERAEMDGSHDGPTSLMTEVMPNLCL